MKFDTTIPLNKQRFCQHSRIMKDEGRRMKDEKLDKQRFCQHSNITTPRDPPYPPFLRGGDNTRLRLG